MTDILIGVGGTGAKVVEATMLLTAAGLGPRQLYVGIVDQDNANGNVQRARDAVGIYSSFRENWQRSSGNHDIDWVRRTHSDDDMSLCRTDVRQLFGDAVLWHPGGDLTTLRSILGQNLGDKRKDLFDLLFSPDGEEQDLDLGEGYRGRAHVGSAALVARLIDPSNKFTTSLSELLEGGGGREPVNVFIVGSAFGGTGAAGFPTIAREINRIRNSSDFANKGQVRIGGALMLPYFGFAPPEADEKARVVNAEELLPKATLALEYYSSLFESEAAFDRFYVLGWDRFFPLGYHKAGNAEQRNPPLLPELFAGAAALTFFETDAEASRSQGQEERIRGTVRHAKLRWKDFPIPNMRERLGQLVRFSAYWRYVVNELVHAKKPFLGKGNWTHQLAKGSILEEAMPALDALEKLSDWVLSYAAEIEATATDNWAGRADLWANGPWSLRQLCDPGHIPDPTEPIRLNDYLHDAPDAFDNLIRIDGGAVLRRDAAAVYDDLENRAQELGAGGHSGFGRIVVAAYRASRVSDGVSENG